VCYAPDERKEEIKNLDTERLNAFIDIFYLLNVTWLYIFSLIYPFFGIIVGLILLNAGKTSQAKRIGKICLIFGIINITLALVFLIVMIITGITQFSRFFAPRV